MTLLLGFSAVNTGNNLLYLLVSALLGFMAVSGLLGQQNLQRLAVEVRPPEELYVGAPTLLRVGLSNRRRWLPGFLLRLELPEGGVLFPVVGAGERLEGSLPFMATQRGRQPLPPVWVRSRFPINFFVRSRRLTQEPELLVLPAPRPCFHPVVADSATAGREQQLPAPGQAGDLQSISDYQGFEPLRTIHWKLSARHDELKVKRLSRLGVEPVVLDPAKLPGAHLEERLSHGVFLVNRLLRRQQPVGLQLGDRLIPPATGRAHRLRLLRELALYDQH